EADEAALDLIAGSRNRLGARRVAVEEAAGQPLRADVDRAGPQWAASARPNDHLRGAAADVDDGDESARMRRGGLERAREPEGTLFDGAQDPGVARGGVGQPRGELPAVRGLAAGARDQDLHVRGAGVARLVEEALDDRRSLVELLARDRAGALDRR